MSEWYDWKDARTTVQWPIKIGEWEQAAGVVRVHNDPDKIPGDYHCAGTIIVKDKMFEVMGFISKDRFPDTGEFKTFYGYLKSLGLTRMRHVRAKDGNITCQT